MKEIQLTKGQIAIVDDEDYEYLSRWKWYAQTHRSDGEYCAARRESRKTTRKMIYMHRIVMNCPDGFMVDHINHNSLDNRKQNLRVCTIQENNRNRRISKNNTTGYKGVFWNKKLKKYVASIRSGRELQYLGLFENPIDAAHAYDTAAKSLFGEFAKLNFMTSERDLQERKA